MVKHSRKAAQKLQSEQSDMRCDVHIYEENERWRGTRRENAKNMF